MGKGKRNREAKKKATKQYSDLVQHKQLGKVLQPPFLTIPGMRTSSWSDDRLPDMLWCALLVTHLPRDLALEVFRRVAKLLEDAFEPNKPVDVGHSGLAELPEERLAAVLRLICSAPGARQVLRPLLLLEKLPAHAKWNEEIGLEPEAEDWDALRVAVAHVFDHQSQEATDCRWLRILVMLLSGQLKLQNAGQVREIVYYPNEGDQNAVRPFIRATEMSFANAADTKAPQWPKAFWDQCWRDTACMPRELTPSRSSEIAGTTILRVSQVSDALAVHFSETTSTTAIDARHQAIFGFAAYALSITTELLRIGAPNSVSARLALRALFEVRVAAAYLYKKDSPELWQQYRAYGSGQAKLAFLKLDEDDARKVGFVDAEALRIFANEDKSAEFVPINVGNWEGSNLRKMSEDAEVKADYDRYYPWTSAYMHANWGAVRATNFDVCLNALHRAHRVLRPTAIALNDVIGDACELVDHVLEVLDAMYPTFPHRVSVSWTAGDANHGVATDE